METILVYTIVFGIILLSYISLIRKEPNYWVPNLHLIEIYRWNIGLSRVFLWIGVGGFIGLGKFILEGNLPIPGAPSLPHIYAVVILPVMYIGLIAKTIASVKEGKYWCLKLGLNKTQLISMPIMALVGVYYLFLKLIEKFKRANYRAR